MYRRDHDRELPQRELVAALEVQVASPVPPDDGRNVSIHACAYADQSGGDAGALIDRDQRESWLVGRAARLSKPGVGVHDAAQRTCPAHKSVATVFIDNLPSSITVADRSDIARSLVVG